MTASNQLLLPATSTVTVAVSAAIIRLLNLWLNGRLAAAVGSDLSCEAYRRTLYQPYSVHLQRNSSAIITSTTTQIAHTIAALNSLLQLATAAVVAVGLFVGLLLIDALVACAAALLFGSAYLALALKARRELQGNGKKMVLSSRQQLKALQEGIGAIRDVLLDGTQDSYLQIYQKADRPLRKLQANNNFLASFPRFALEALGMVAISTLGGLLVVQRGSGFAVIPLLGSLALGAQRLLPALQQIYSGWATLKGYETAMQDVLSMLNQPLPLVLDSFESLYFQKSIKFSRVQFRYASNEPDVLKDFRLEIHRGERIGLIGNTGSGKTTTIDLLMGLIQPTGGQIFVDGIDLHDPLHPGMLNSWRSIIAHVPQNIFLSDGSIAENIAFGVPKAEIDMERVITAANESQISAFVESTSEGFNSFVGERGIRLSGGQRQRIGIARALYKQAQILVFDEATSALDNSTEQAVMDSIDTIGRDFTIILIAHRLSTIKNCDRVIKLDNGTVSFDGSPDDVLKSL